MLVKWPKELHTFTFIHDTLEYWPWKSFQPILETQMVNLRELTIRHWRECEEDMRYLDLTGFTMLERLSLCTALTGFDKCHIPRIVAPNLKSFTWRITDGDINNAIFIDRHEIWLRAMVEFAATQRKRLKTILVVIDQEWGGQFNFNVESDNDYAIYPWDLLDDIDQDSKKFGIRIRYEVPYMSREKFELYRYEHRRRNLIDEDSSEDGHTSEGFTSP